MKIPPLYKAYAQKEDFFCIFLDSIRQDILPAGYIKILEIMEILMIWKIYM